MHTAYGIGEYIRLAVISLILAAIAAPVVYCFLQFQCFARYVAEAKLTGLLYVSVPFGCFRPFWTLLQPLFLPFLHRIPKS